MKLLQRFGTLFTALVITSCASMQPQLPEVQIPPERISQKGYSLEPLNEKGWLIAERNAYQLGLVKRGENPDEKCVIEAKPVRLFTFKTNEEFVRLIKEGQAKDNPDPQRLKLVKHEVTPYPTNGTTCGKSHVVIEDRAAVRRSGKSGDMVIEMLTLICAHPKDKNVGISITYSQRYYPGHRDNAFLEKANTVLNSLEFTDL